MAGYYDRDRRPRNGVGAPQSWDSQTAAGTMNHPTTHIGNTSEYQASGYPFVQTIPISGTLPDESGSTITLANNDVIKITFPYVTRWIILKGVNAGGTAEVPIGNIHIGFSEAGVKTAATRVDLALFGDQRLEVKCSELFIQLADISACTQVEIMAGLTNIPSADFVVTTPAGTNVGVESAATVLCVHDNAS